MSEMKDTEIANKLLNASKLFTELDKQKNRIDH